MNINHTYTDGNVYGKIHIFCIYRTLKSWELIKFRPSIYPEHLYKIDDSRMNDLGTDFQ